MPKKGKILSVIGVLNNQIKVDTPESGRGSGMKTLMRKRLNPIWQGLQENALCARRQDAMVKAVCPLEHASTVVSQVTREDSAESISKQS